MQVRKGELSGRTLRALARSGVEVGEELFRSVRQSLVAGTSSLGAFEAGGVGGTFEAGGVVRGDGVEAIGHSQPSTHLTICCRSRVSLRKSLIC